MVVCGGVDWTRVLSAPRRACHWCSLREEPDDPAAPHLPEDAQRELARILSGVPGR
ncbi:hypothetical protein FDG2_1414 [Candidatus Protofrankia californiensis]|uniref:Uncharacterized protein n=1 Tax=Candidatus Protofrankia californiensis TaxID=1839754 RepID=A0A1C3NVM3_9ACTN|nr:hypothetical protein FDG2_1414 [Candidatus Protofrankia californiensis]